MKHNLRKRYGHAPTAFREGLFKADFYSIDCTEKPHVHVRRADGVAKIWLIPVRTAWARWDKKSTARAAERFVLSNRVELLRQWERHCGEASK